MALSKMKVVLQKAQGLIFLKAENLRVHKHLEPLN